MCLDAVPASRVPLRGARASPELADVLRIGLPGYVRKHKMPPQHHKVLAAITKCRTPEMGGQLYRCSDCGKEHTTSHGCGNRHCPKCQGRQARLWLERQREALLPVPYFHIVFTLPHALNPLIRHNRALLYKLLFDCASATLLEFAHNRFGGQGGLTAVLHTWSQQLTEHYHLHCIMPGGAFDSGKSEWMPSKSGYCFPVKALSKVFRAKYRDGLRQLFDAGRLNLPDTNGGLSDFKQILRTALAKNWVVYAKAPFGGPAQVLAYLSRYTHRVAIADTRILAVNAIARTVTFKYRDYADASKKKQATIGIEDFIHRFRSHILPLRFCKIRHYGILSNATRKANVAQIKAAIGPVPDQMRETSGEKSEDIDKCAGVPCCPNCGHDALVLVGTFVRRLSPIRKPP